MRVLIAAGLQLGMGFGFGALLCIHRAEATVLTVCVDIANPTAAMDLRVASAVAKTQGFELKKVEFEGRGKGDDGFPPSRFAKMAAADCELIMGFPVDVSNPNVPDNVQATSPYARTGFVLVRRANSKDVALGDLPKGSEVGIAQLDTYAGLLYGIHANIVMHVYDQDGAMLADLAAKRIVAGVAWQPTIESYELSHPKAAPVRMSLLPEKHMLWNLVALYAPRGEAAANAFNKGLYDLASHAELQPLIKPYSPAAAVEVEHASSRLASPHLMSAVAWSGGDGRSGEAGHHGDAGRMIAVVGQAPRLMSAAAWSGNEGYFIQVTDPATATATAPAQHTSKSGGKVPALYTEDQATKGELLYYQNCSMCHGPNLDGQEGGYSGPALQGKDFADPSYDFHVSDIFNFVAKQMPAATPGSLSHEVDVQIMAFILKRNGYPAGNKELVYEEAEKSKVPIRYHGK